MDDVLTFETEETYYDILGCGQCASHEQICTEYRVKAKTFHPDKYPENDEENKKKFQRINEAYKVLSDEQERKDYDKWLNSGLAIPYSVWKKRSHHTLHWASSTDKKLKIMEKESILASAIDPHDERFPNTPNQHPATSFSMNAFTTRKKFRNYQI